VTVWQTLLVFVGIPAGIIALIALAVYGKSMVRQPNRYRPGRAWDYPPSWAQYLGFSRSDGAVAAV
jgi:hypothetical protein